MVDVIAEIGSAPAPEWDFALWCEAVAQTGATHIKAQCFKAEHFPFVEQAGKRQLEFPRDRLGEFVQAAHGHGLKCGVSVFDAEAVELAAQHCDFLKLAARESGNGELRAAVIATGKPFYQSFSNNDAARGWWHTPHGITMWTFQRYPTPLLVALFHLLTISKPEDIRWGWSSHTRSAFDCILAVRLGASVIEKHIALTPNDKEAGHSLLPDAFGRMVREIKRNSPRFLVGLLRRQ